MTDARIWGVFAYKSGMLEPFSKQYKCQARINVAIALEDFLCIDIMPLETHVVQAVITRWVDDRGVEMSMAYWEI